MRWPWFESAKCDCFDNTCPGDLLQDDRFQNFQYIKAKIFEIIRMPEQMNPVRIMQRDASMNHYARSMASSGTCLDIVRPGSIGRPERRIVMIGEDLGKGFRSFERLSSDFDSIVTDVHHVQDVMDHVEGADQLKFHFKLAGDNLIRFGENREFRLRGGRSVVALHPKGLVKEDCYRKQISEKSLTLCCRPSLITNTLQIDPDRLPPELACFAGGQDAQFYCREFPLTSRMVQAIDELAHSPYSSAVYHIHAYSRTLDLICMLIDALIGHEAEASDANQLRERDIDAIHAAREILLDQIEEPITIPELARFVGINRTKLSDGFKQIFGESVFDFSQRVRLEQANRLLRDTQLPISSIALAVGYEHQSSFSTAYRSRYGITPRQARQS